MPVVVELSQSEKFSEDDDEVPLLSQIQIWANAACLDDGDVIASIQMFSKDEMRSLNRDYGGKDKPTNVLSFPMQLPDRVKINLLGDLALCAQVINSEAEQQNKSRESHWAHMVVHGMLHLQGYDHKKEEEAMEMESLEIRILDELGFDNPYDTNF